MSILVSINCITYNHEEYIANAIDGFIIQRTDFDFEIIIGEDCSTDNTKEIIDEYINKYPNKIKLITSEYNVGMDKNSRRTFENSKGKYIAVCEGDDYWTDPYKLQKQVDYLESNPGCTLCFHAAEIVEAPQKKTGRKIRSYNSERFSPIEDIIYGGGGFCHTASLVYPRKLMESPPSFIKEADVGDYPKQMYLASRGYAYYIDDCMSAYRVGVKGSWTERMYSEGNKKNNAIINIKGEINILTGFNEYTNNEYAKVVEKKIIEKEFEILLIQGERKEGKNERYKEYANSLRLKEKLRVRLLFRFPKSYAKLARIKEFIFNKRLIN